MQSLERPEAMTRAELGPCLDDETLVSFVRGVVEPSRIEAIDAHLDDCESCFDLAAELAREATKRPTRGDRVGRYTVIDELGRGAMGLVVSAFDAELDRKVALKLIPAAAVASSRGLEEARALARVTHPNVVAVYEVGEAGGHVFIAMELVLGVTLRAWLETPRSVEEVREVLLAAGAGLAAAHERGVVHRDFKPDNVMIAEGGVAKVTDFGLALLREPTASPGAGVLEDEDELLTTVTAAGTPAYMAPELFARAPASAASDQFAFGVTAFEALYGARPYPAKDLPSLVEATKRGVIAAPRGRGVPSFVGAAVTRALAPEPAARFPSMGALLLELTKDKRTNHRRRARVAFGAAALALTAAVVATSLRDRAPACDAGAERFAARWSAARSRLVEAAPPGQRDAAERLATAVDAWGKTWAAAHDGACARTARGEQSEALLDRQVACLERQALAIEPLVTAASERGGTAAAAALDRLDDVLDDPALCAAVDPAAASALPSDPAARATIEALSSRVAGLRAALAIDGPRAVEPSMAPLVADARRAAYAPLEAEVYLLAADVRRGLGDFDAARRSLGDALLAFAKASDRRGDATAWLRFMSLHGSQGLYAEAEHTARLVHPMLLGLGNPPDLELEFREVMGAVYTATGRLEQAEDELDRALSLDAALSSGPSRARSRVLTNLGNLARAQGDLQRALELHERARAADEERLGAANPSVPRHLHNLAGVLKMMGRREEALSAYRDALARREALFGRETPESALTHNSLGIFLAEEGDLAEGRRHLLEAKRIFSATDHAHAEVAKENLAWLARLEDGDRAAAPVAAPSAAPDQSARPSPPPTAPAPAATATELPKVAAPAPSARPTTSVPTRINTPNGSGAYVPSPAWP